MRLAGRSPQELAFRIWQQIANLAILAIPPKLPSGYSASDLPLPAGRDVAARLAVSAFKSEILAMAEQILEHRFPILDAEVSTGAEIEWRRDYIHGKTTDLSYFRFIPYLDFERAGDHKNIWELSRYQHIVVLAQAELFESRPEYVKEIQEELESWWIQNPFLKGINWASALEVAFRALSWLWIDHLVGLSLENGFRERLWNSLYQHAAYLEHNLSTYFSPNTHLLGEAVTLHAIGIKFGKSRWREMGAQVVREQLDRQVQEDGSHFEQSTYYHVYALDFFVFHYLLEGRPAAYVPKLRRMAEFLRAILGPARLLTCFGDDDGGRLFHPYGPRDQFGRATLATCGALFPEESLPFELEDIAPQCAWWLGVTGNAAVSANPETRLFPNSGLAVIARGDVHILIDSGPFGSGGAGHSHADTLSVTVRVNGREVLIDPGTFTYVADAKLRDAFRGTPFHNTISIDSRNQAEAAGPFRWNQKPTVRRLQWSDQGDLVFLDAECSFREFRHRRRFLLVGDELLVVLDEVNSSAPTVEHTIDQHWHLGDLAVPILFSDPGAVHREEGLRSRVLGQKEPAAVLLASWRTSLPHFSATALCFRPVSPDAILELKGLDVSIPNVVSVSFGVEAVPIVTRP
jgi:Heparinase II/III-like protein/Heparinase II/III N-terminus